MKCYIHVPSQSVIKHILLVTLSKKDMLSLTPIEFKR